MKIKNFVLLLLMSHHLVAQAEDKKIKLYAFYTPSHKEMCEQWFLPSIQDDFELILECFDQECKSANFMEDGWMATMVHKVNIVIRGVRENMGGYFIHSDVDIQFFGSIQNAIEESLKGKDLVIQRDNPAGGACAGFFACRANQKTLALWNAVKAGLGKNRKNDQDVLNDLLREGKFGIKWGYLPESFFGGGTFSGKRWQAGEDLKIPKNPLMHHANYTVGIPNKLAQLEYVRTHCTNN